MKKLHRGLTAALLGTLLCAASAQAGGVTLVEIGTDDLATAYAGAAARAADAGTAFTNPAGMTRLKGTQFIAAAQPMLIRSKFDAKAGTTNGGGGGGDAGGIMPDGALYATFELAEDLRAGFVVNSFAGLGLKYDDTWAGRYFTQESSLKTYNFEPTLAYRVNDWFSVGVGAHFVAADQTMRFAVDNVAAGDPAGTPDGQVKFNDTTWGIGGTAGVLFEPLKCLRFGVTYRSPIDLDFSNNAKYSNLGASISGAVAGLHIMDKLDVRLTLPQQVMSSVVYSPVEGLDLMANLGWEQYSQFARSMISVTVAGSRVTSGRDYDDTWHTGLGARYAFNRNWSMAAGVSYDSSMAKESVRTPDLPADRVYRFAGGLNYAFENGKVGLSYEYADLGSASIDRTNLLTGRLNGSYDTNEIHVLAVNLEWRF